ncbi:hypothetical protein OL548_29940 [Lysinibacillus sp. MHQ-1]|nr:hypothetical protein OL548_29940 [Lysinibacillus sp. MHQ-1]
MLQAGLSEQLVPSSLLTLEVREAIAKLAFFISFNSARYAKKW